MYDALSTDAMKKESKPIFDAMYNVITYAEKCYKKEYAKDTMEQLTKILTVEDPADGSCIFSSRMDDRILDFLGLSGYF